ncbi:MAG: zinc ribbon domain-containing protein [Myxococcales bacterium]
MPLYEFQCKKCDLVFEDLVSSSTKTADCPKCSGKGKRILSACCSHVEGGGSSASSGHSHGSGGGCGGCHGGNCGSCH